MTAPLLGIVQGRLSSVSDGTLQCFPQKTWKEEFKTASHLGFDYIELIAEEVFNPKNPIWTDVGVNQIKEIASRHSSTLFAVCDDYIIRNSLQNCEVLRKCKSLIKQSALLGCQIHILPLMGKSLATKTNQNQFVLPLRDLADFAYKNKIQICLETNGDAEFLKEFFEILDHQNIKLVFDTGNRAAQGFSLHDDIITLRELIAHIHVKDKTSNDENVEFGTGLVKFGEVFEALNMIDYRGAYTIESIRSSDPIVSAKAKLSLLKSFLN